MLHDDCTQEQLAADQRRDEFEAANAMTDDAMEAEYQRQCAGGEAEWAPMPTLKPIMAKVRQLDPAAWQ